MWPIALSDLYNLPLDEFTDAGREPGSWGGVMRHTSPATKAQDRRCLREWRSYSWMVSGSR
jgi:hypothetical protein